MKPHWRSKREKRRSQAVVHIEFDRMRRHPEARNFFHLELNVSIYHVIRKHSAASQEIAILVQTVQCFIQGSARIGNSGSFLGWKVIEILIHGIARMNLVLDSIQSGH